MNALALRDAARQCLDRGEPAIDVWISDIQGSAPREAGTHMLVTAREVLGTIGGGHLEWEAIRVAREQLAARAVVADIRRYALGPSLGQCCGGVVHLRYTPLTGDGLSLWTAPRPRFHLQLHGAGHVGRAIVRLLHDIDGLVQWVDTRGDEFPGEASPPHIRRVVSEEPPAEVASVPPGACYLVMTHRHDLDFQIVEAIVRREDAHFVGLIGSATKSARLRHRLLVRGHPPEQVAAVQCPVGLPGITGKSPAVLAVSVVAQLLALTPARD